MTSNHRVLFQDSRNLKDIPSNSIDLIVTSPPYPMIEMWDSVFGDLNPEVNWTLKNADGSQAFELMHRTLDAVWSEIFRVLKDGRFACINIGDATRKLKNDFCLYPNHARILNCLSHLGFSTLPDILWRKQTNAPNKFMGSGMLPAGAYVTLEHEYILIVRKGHKRDFRTEEERTNRRESAIFWEERNVWYSDIWLDVKGTGQKLTDQLSRIRSAAFPFELAYRLINMYSVKNDLVLDPFLGTGTTVAAAMASGRNSIGIEIDKNLENAIKPVTDHITSFSNNYLLDRLQKHFAFVEKRIQNSQPLKYINHSHDCPVVTSQEQLIQINSLKDLRNHDGTRYEIDYSTQPEGGMCYSNWRADSKAESKRQEHLKKSSPSAQLDLIDSF